MIDDIHMDDITWFWHQIDKLAPEAGSRAMAVRRWVESHECLRDIGFFCTLWGIRDIESEIRELIIMSDEMIGSAYQS